MTRSAEDASEPKRRGRRPAGEDTRSALIGAARTVFAEQGYDGATVRAIATHANVDAAMVNHWFGSKEGLFVQAVLDVPFEPRELIDTLLDGDRETLGERIVRTFLTTWDGAGGEVFRALIRSVAGHEQVATVIRDFFVKQVFHRLVDTLGTNQPEFRAALCGSQIIGMGMVRYIAKIEPVASAEIDDMVNAVAANLQRYLTGSIDGPTSSNLGENPP